MTVFKSTISKYPKNSTLKKLSSTPRTQFSTQNLKTLLYSKSLMPNLDTTYFWGRKMKEFLQSIKKMESSTIAFACLMKWVFSKSSNKFFPMLKQLRRYHKFNWLSYAILLQNWDFPKNRHTLKYGIKVTRTRLKVMGFF